MLSKISIEGFKSIERLQQFKLQNVNVLIGANGSGKSNFIEAFRMVNRIMEERLQLYIGQNGGLSKLLHFGPKRTSEMNIALDFDTNGYEFSLTQAQSDSGVFSKEVAWFHDKSKYPTPYKDHLRAGHRETALTLHAQKPGIAKHVLNWIRSWRLYHFHDTSPSSKIKQLQAMDDNAVLREDASNLAPFLFFLRMRHPGHYENIVSTIRQVAPFFRDFALRESPFSPGRMKLEWLEAGSDEYMDASALSDGTLRFICIVVLFLQPFPPDTILLDEPELCKHAWGIDSDALPAWQRALIGVLYPLQAFMMRRAFRITEANYRKSRDRIDAMLADTEASLADGRASILGGDTLNYTDLAFAAIQGIWLQPPGYGGGAGISIERDRVPPAMRRDIERWIEDCPAVTRFIETLYANERNED